HQATVTVTSKPTKNLANSDSASAGRLHSKEYRFNQEFTSRPANSTMAADIGKNRNIQAQIPSPTCPSAHDLKSPPSNRFSTIGPSWMESQMPHGNMARTNQSLAGANFKVQSSGANCHR